MDNKYCLDYLKQLLKTLLCDSSAKHIVPKEIIWNISSDIANEWDYENIAFFVQNLVECNIISTKIKESIQTICNNFDDVSLNGAQFDQSIWTPEGFFHHSFWQHQRKLAKQVLDEIDKIKL